eukprot:13652139-Ditylum_brightwellii.AAC.1
MFKIKATIGVRSSPSNPVIPRTWWIHGAEGSGPGKMRLELAVCQLEDALCLETFRGKPFGLVCYNMRSTIFLK